MRTDRAIRLFCLRVGPFVAALACVSANATADVNNSTVRVETDTLRVEFAARGAQPVLWETCHPTCGEASGKKRFVEPGDPPFLVLSFPDSPLVFEERDFEVRREDDDEAVVLTFLSQPFAGGLRIEKTYRIPRRGYVGQLSVRIVGEGAAAFARDNAVVVHVRPGSAFRPTPSAGFAGSLERTRSVYESGASFELIEEQVPLEAKEWAGVRNRFWGMMVRSERSATVRPDGDGVILAFRPDGGQVLDLRFFTGPLRWQTLREANSALCGVLFHDLWFWMRWLTLGLLFLWQGLARVVVVAAIAIVLTSVVVKILMLPLAALANRWQSDVNEKQSFLRPRIREIQESFKGEERHRRILELYESNGIHPMYALKSLFGVAIQIPVFFAAYHMLGENFALDGVSFLWIDDLARPDRLATLPFDIPFFGDGLNLLPFLMTGISLLSTRVHSDRSLSPDLLRKQRRNLYWIAAAFFVLFYTFPAGMVLYWTTNNALHLLKERFSPTGLGHRPAGPGLSGSSSLL